MMGAVKAEGNLDYDAEKNFAKNQLDGQNEVKKALQEAGYYRDRIRRKVSITFQVLATRAPLFKKAIVKMLSSLKKGYKEDLFGLE